MGLLEHRRLLCVVTRTSLPMLTVLDAELVLQVAHDPHLANDIAIEGHVCTLEEFHEETRGYT